MTAIHWFRNDLRVHDHRVLGCLPAGVQHLLCIYIIDERTWQETVLGFSKTGAFRSRFLYETLVNLDGSLQHIGNRLLVCVGSPPDVLAAIVRNTNAAFVTTDAEVTSEELAVDAAVRAAIGVPLHRAWSRTLLHPEDLPQQVNDMPDTFTVWRNSVERSLHIRAEHPTPTLLPPPPPSYATKTTQIDLLQQLGMHERDSRTAFPFMGGESSALARLQAYVWETRAIATYKETRNGLIGTEYSSKLSAWLAVGAISPRRIYNEVQRFERGVLANDSTYWLVVELLWRDFFRFSAMKHGVRLFHRDGITSARTTWRHDQRIFEAWRTGTCGDVFVDANMRELLHTGWMSNRGRQNVASWLTKTHHIDWRWGAAWFEHALIDYDVCSNWGNWAYVAGVGADSRSDRSFNTTKQAEMYDPQGEYRARWNGEEG